MRKSTRILLVLLVTGLLLAWPISYFFTKLEKPQGGEHLAELDKLADELLTLTMKGDVEAARIRVAKLAATLPNQTFPVTIRLESLHAVTQSILAAKQAFASSKSSEEKLLWHATQVRVAIDALSHAHQPMWRNYYTSYANQMQHLLEAAVERNVTDFRSQFEENYWLYLAIRPAMGIQLREEEMEAISAAYDLIVKEVRKDSPDWQLIREALRDLNATTQEVFVGKEKTVLGRLVGQESPVMLIVTVAAAVTLTLTYVAWKKYVAEQENLV